MTAATLAIRVFIATCTYPCDCGAQAYYQFPPATHRYEADFYRRHPGLYVPACEQREWRKWRY